MHPLDDRALWLARNILPHERALRAWLQKRLVAGLDVDDIVQETYARLSTVQSVADIRDPKRYAFQAAHSVVVSYVRRSNIVSIQAMANLDAIGTISDEPNPEICAADRDELHRLALAIADLPGKIRDVFVLRRVRGLSQREVAERLGLSESTVEKHMSKSFRHLSTMFGRGGNSQARASRDEQRETVSYNDQTKQPND